MFVRNAAIVEKLTQTAKMHGWNGMNNTNVLTNERLNELSTMHGADSSILEEAIKEAAEMAREILSLRAQLAELREQEPFGFINGVATDGGIEILSPVRLLDTDVAVYSRPVPPAASQPDEARWCPNVDPISGREFFLWLEHPTLGCVPTYGGPYDSFTLTERDENGEFFRHRYDHDEGAWVDDEAVYLDEEAKGQLYTLRSATFDEIRDVVAEMTGGIPVTWRDGLKKGHHEVPFMNFNSLGRIVDKFRASTFNHTGDLLIQPYTVPDEMVTSDSMTLTAQVFAKGHNACRAAMLQLSGKAGQVNSPVIPDGWVKGKFAYDTLFNAIGKAVNIQGEALSISVKAFEDSMIAAAPQHKGE
ncbi:hypothetical protein PEC311524_19480 [Pectobacterium carotovorum subsp. carotovorum]|nr:hypothetical protein PEC311524_19480 [Pectobacterium carotovorum subsp. carotovorum]